jgi:hypothetical protein
VLPDAEAVGVALCANAKEARPAEAIRVLRIIFMVDFFKVQTVSGGALKVKNNSPCALRV